MSDSAFHRINDYPVNKYNGNKLHYLIDIDLSSRWRYPPFQQLGPGFNIGTLPWKMDLNTPEIVTLLLKHTSRYEELLSKQHKKTVCLVSIKKSLTSSSTPDGLRDFFFFVL